MVEITKQYTYKLPDTYFGNTWAEKKTASAMYTGPQEGYVFVNKETGRLVFDASFHWIYSTNEYTEEEIAADIKEQLDIRCNASEAVVKVNASNSNEETLIAAAMLGINTSEWPDKEYAFPEGHANAGEVYHVDPDPLPVTDVLDVERGIKYDFDTETWTLDECEFIPPFCTEESHSGMVAALKAQAIEMKESGTWDAAQEAELDRVIAECDELPSKFAGIHWLMVKFPQADQDILFPPAPEEPTAPEEAAEEAE